MGWLEYSASYYKGNKIDKVAEVKKIFTQEESEKYPRLRVLKTVTVGREVYLALEVTKNGKTTILPECVLTSVDNKLGLFAYKAVGYYGFNFPKTIVQLVNDPDEKIMEWKQGQLKFLAEKKQKVKLENGDKVIFTNSSFGGENEWIYSGKYNGSHLFYNTKYGYKKLKGWTKADYEIIKKTA